MIIKASAKYVRGSPRKVRLVANSVVGLSPAEALVKLSLLDKKAKEIISKVINQGVANAQNNFKIEKESLKIKSLIVGEGPRVKRMDKSHAARFNSGIIRKRFFHLWLALESEKEEVKNGQ